MADQVALPQDPIDGFLLWLSEAEKAGLPEPTAMTLATVGLDMRPSARIVLFKGLSLSASGDRSPRFFTNYESRKSLEISAHPQVSLVFHWATQQRQIRIEGLAEKVSRKESEEYFHTRARGSQIGAWASPQSRPLKDRAELDGIVSEIETRFKDRQIECPPFWGGWRVVPDRFEFWQGVPNRLHDRFVFERIAQNWTLNRLAP
jgi:pyridoxamine 5'-phosphate oxidase